MSSGQVEFQDRLHRLLRKHRALANGYTSRVQPDGLIVAKPRRKRAKVPVRSAVILLTAFFCFKALLIINLGESDYGLKVARLWSGNAVEKAGALVMQPDPLSSLIAEKAGPLLKK